ncbi:MAG: RNA polymerase subunit sigma-70 [Armatimonadetes bacterium]|nr:MAG: RNA polymerase subunit sigma-70 [Armatimonadota bacterium]
MHDPEVFAVIFDRHHVSIFRYLARRLGSASAEDSTSEVFARAYEHRSRFDRGRESARPWLFGIARNVLMNEQRRRVNDRSSPTAEIHHEIPDPADSVAWTVDAQRFVAESGLDKTIAELPEGTREVLFLYAFGELSYKEIADTLDIPLGTVRSRLGRARAALREQAPAWREALAKRLEGRFEDG